MRVFLLTISALWCTASLALGEISARYESGGLGVGAISTGYNDPGGKSYGTHQLALNTGTLSAYIQQSSFKSELVGITGTLEFDKQWTYLAENHTEAFEQDQLRFIAKTHFLPLRRIADKLGYKNTDKINEAIFSMGVQHGKAYKILRKVSITVDIKSMSTDDIIRELYAERSQYIKHLNLNKSVESAILKRYSFEQIDIINLN